MGRELSTNPNQIKNRLRRKMTNIEEEVNRLKPLEEWDWEELQRGYPKGENGHFGKKPAWAEAFRATHEVQRRIRSYTSSQLSSYAGKALNVLVDLMEDDSVDLDGKPTTPASVRQKAAEYVLDQTIGRPTAKVEVEAGEGLKEFLADIMVNDDGEDAHPVIIPGAVVEDNDIEEIEDLED